MLVVRSADLHGLADRGAHGTSGGGTRAVALHDVADALVEGRVQASQRSIGFYAGTVSQPGSQRDFGDFEIAVAELQAVDVDPFESIAVRREAPCLDAVAVLIAARAAGSAQTFTMQKFNIAGEGGTAAYAAADVADRGALDERRAEPTTSATFRTTPSRCRSRSPGRARDGGRGHGSGS